MIRWNTCMVHAFAASAIVALPLIAQKQDKAAAAAAPACSIPTDKPDEVKSALNALVQVLAAEERSNGITANAVLPDSMATPAMLQSTDAAKLVPLERVSETIAFLLSDAAAGTSGALIPIRA